jgi:hypothetical protein
MAALIPEPAIFAVQPADAALFLQALTRCAENGFGRDVEAAATLLCRESWGEHQTWAALKDLPHGPLGRTRLMYAARKGDLPRLRWLLARGARVDKNGWRWPETSVGKTALMYACEEGNVEVVRELLAHDANVNAVEGYDGMGRTALRYASKRGHVNVVEELLRSGAHVNASFRGRTVLDAIKGGIHYDAISPLLLAKDACHGSFAGSCATSQTYPRDFDDFDEAVFDDFYEEPSWYHRSLSIPPRTPSEPDSEYFADNDDVAPYPHPGMLAYIESCG